MLFHELPNDIICKIYNHVMKEEVSVLEKFKNVVIDFLAKEKIVVSQSIYNTNEIIDNMIRNYIKCLTKKEIDSIVCEYGISKAMKLLHDYNKICLDKHDTFICHNIANKHNIEESIVELIINDEIGYKINWRFEGNGRFNTIQEIEDAVNAHIYSRGYNSV